MNYKLFSFDKIPSTQAYAQELVAAGKAADHQVVLADAQSAGRGRYRRQWVSHHGNLYASFIFAAPERDPKISYAVAVAVARAIRAAGAPAEIKWPNDIKIGGKKVAGILIEYAKNFVIIGIGINIKNAPQTTQPTTKLEYYAKISRDELLAELMKQLDIWLGRLETNFENIRAVWTELAIGIGMEITYKNKPARLCGITADGALALLCNEKYLLVFGDEILG